MLHKVKKKYALIFILFLICIKLNAIRIDPDTTQINSIYFADSNNFYFNFQNQNFFWNNEYFGSIAAGYTLIGYHVTPTIEYHFSNNFKVEAGVHMLKYSGVDDFSTIMPSYSAVFHNKNISFVMGSLYGGSYHLLPDVVYNYERNFTHNQENGIQFRIDSKRLFLDVWFDWQTFIFRGDDKQEEFIAGVSTEPVLIKKNNFSFSTPSFMLVSHKGGQINTVEDKITTSFNIGSGAKFDYKFNNGFFSKITAKTQIMLYANEGPGNEWSDTLSAVHLYYMKMHDEFKIKSEGNGVYSNVKLSKGNSFVSLGHWYANNFVSLVGNNIYQSLSEGIFAGNKWERNLLTAQVYYSHRLVKYVEFGIMCEALYDINTMLIDYSTGVKICVDANFKLGKLRINRAN